MKPLGVLALILFLIILAALLLILKADRRIEEIRQLTRIPTVESEPRNRASYYLTAAAAVVPPPPSLEDALKTLGEKRFDQVAVEALLQTHLLQNKNVIDIMTSTKDLSECRMPLLCGANQFPTGAKLEAVGDTLFWATLQRFWNGDYQGACEVGLVNLRFGRDVSSAGSFAQATSGMHIFQMASRALAIGVTQYALGTDSLKLLEERLPACDYPEGFDFDALSRNHRMWISLVRHDHDPWGVQLVRALGLENVIDIRRYNPSQPGLAYHNANDTNPLMAYSEPFTGAFDCIEGMSMGVALLRLGVAAQQYRADTGHLPASTEDLVPEYLARLPECPPGTEITMSMTNQVLRIASTGVPHRISRRALVFGADALNR